MGSRPFAPPGTVSGQAATILTPGVQIVEVDIYLNAYDFRYVFTLPDAGEVDTQAVLTHELGHALGLLHPCEVEVGSTAPLCDATMSHLNSALYPKYLGERARDLGTDDKSGLCSLYDPDICVPTCPVGYDCVDSACVDPVCDEAACPSACAGGVCAGETCTADEACDTGACALVGHNEGLCIQESAFGTPCSGGLDCGTGVCAEPASGGGFCSRFCSADADCGGLACRDAGGRRVCAPLPPSSGCSTSGGPPPPGVPELPLGTLSVIALLAHVRRVRRAARHQEG